MESCVCTEERRIKNIEKTIEAIQKNLEGSQGVYASLKVLMNISETQSENMDKLSKNVDTLIKFMTESEKEKETIIRVTKDNQQKSQEIEQLRIGKNRFVITTVIALACFIISLIGIILIIM